MAIMRSLQVIDACMRRIENLQKKGWEPDKLYPKVNV
jgi:hypothetical protein